MIMALPFRSWISSSTFHRKTFPDELLVKTRQKTSFAKNFCPKNKKPTRCEWVETFCAVSNYRIAPRILDGWVPKSKPIRVGATIHGHSVFRSPSKFNGFVEKSFASRDEPPRHVLEPLSSAIPRFRKRHRRIAVDRLHFAKVCRYLK